MNLLQENSTLNLSNGREQLAMMITRIYHPERLSNNQWESYWDGPGFEDDMLLIDLFFSRDEDVATNIRERNYPFIKSSLYRIEAAGWPIVEAGFHFEVYQGKLDAHQEAYLTFLLETPLYDRMNIGDDYYSLYWAFSATEEERRLYE